MHGQKCRQIAIDCLQKLAASLQIQPPDWTTAVLAHLFDSDGEQLNQTQALIHNLCRVAFVRIADEHAFALWGSCRQSPGTLVSNAPIRRVPGSSL